MKDPKHATGQVVDPAMRVDRAAGICRRNRDRVDREVSSREVLGDLAGRTDVWQSAGPRVGLGSGGGHVELAVGCRHGGGRKALVDHDHLPERRGKPQVIADDDDVEVGAR